MLRVRPIIFTTKPGGYAALFTALGLRRVEDRPGWTVFDSGSGKLAVQQIAPGALAGTHLGFELRDAQIFVRRTLADGTHAELTATGSAQVTAPDGFSFLADPSTDSGIPAPDAPLAVVAIWRSPRPEAASSVLANIGAKYIRGLSGGGALFRAKNGGFAATAAGGVSGVELGLKYDGDPAALAAALTAAGVQSAPAGDALHLQTPDGANLTIARWRES